MAGKPRFPVPKFHFSVNIDGYHISFQEISGLDQEFEYMEYRSGERLDLTKQKRAGLMKTGQISCKKGVFDCDDAVMNIFNCLHNENEKYRSQGTGVSMLISLLDESGDPVINWNVTGAIPVKMSNGSLKSDENSYAIEQIDFVFENITSNFE